MSNVKFVVPAQSEASRAIMSQVVEARKAAPDATLATLLTPVIALVKVETTILADVKKSESALAKAVAEDKAAKAKRDVLARVRFDSARFAIREGFMAPHGVRKGKWATSKQDMADMLGVSQPMVTSYARKVAEDGAAEARAKAVRAVVSSEDAPKDSALAEQVAAAATLARKGSESDLADLKAALETKDVNVIADAVATVEKRVEDGADLDAVDRAIAVIEKQGRRSMDGADTGRIRDMAIRLATLADLMSEAAKAAA